MYLRSQHIDDGLNFNVNFVVLNIQMLNLKSRLSNLSLTVIVDILIVWMRAIDDDKETKFDHYENVEFYWN